MDIQFFIGLQLLVIMCAYIQTTTGFGFGLIFMSVAVGFDVLSITDGALFAMFLSLVNIALSVRKNAISPSYVKKMPFVVMVIPGIICGVYGLYALSDNVVGYRVLYGILGVFIIGASVSFMVQSKPLPHKSPIWTFYGMSFITGLFAGLFAVGSPFIAYLVYRQPWAIAFIRQVLLITFAMAIASRIGFVWITKGLPMQIMLWVVLSMPTVYLSNHITKKHLIHRISPQYVRLVVFLLLATSGLKTTYMALLGW